MTLTKYSNTEYRLTNSNSIWVICKLENVTNWCILQWLHFERTYDFVGEYGKFEECIDYILTVI